jgi:3-hydroxyacyl-CoA dehydrogenase / enoyl-CoA hydratase / 3-hydroxybutyryl-CoA epimerase
MAEHTYWNLQRNEAGIATLTLDVPDAGANTLSTAVLEELETMLNELEQDLPKGLLLQSGKAGSFVAGADINEFPKLTDRAAAVALIQRGHAVFSRLAQLPCPTVALLKGATLGGGLELALCCRYRVMQESPDRSLGLPEVQLGLHPGLGGTVRVVNLIGVRAAMDLMLSGRSLSPAEALKRGLIDKVVPAAELREAAETLLQQQPAVKTPALLDRLLGIGILRPLLARVLRKQVAAKAKPDQYPAPYAIIDLWQRYGAKPATAYAAEAESFADLLATDTSKNLVRVFFLQDGLKHEPAADVPAAERVHVVGAGVMGGDIAAWCALRGCTVTLQDREEKYIQPALKRAEELFKKRLRAPALVAEAMGRLQSDVAGRGVANADVIVEAIFENLEAKQELLKHLEAEMRPEALLTSNTSSIPLEDIAAALQNPARLVGLHFFNPVAKMPLIEVIRHVTVAESAVTAAVGFARQLGKLPLICKSSPGFLVNRVLGPYLDEAMRLTIDGFSPEDIDKAARDFGMPMGPIELADSVGLDIGLHVAEGLAAITGREVPAKLQQMVADGLLGRKSGQGFYRYADGKTVRNKTTAAAKDPEVQARLIYSLLNESADCLHEGVAKSVDEVDAGVIFGTGFAPFRGGPLHYAQQLGLPVVAAELEHLRGTYGERFAASEGWNHTGLAK